MGSPFIVQLPNRPGELGHLARALGMRGVNIQHICGSGAGDLACALLSTDDDDATSDVLRSMGMQYVHGDTLVAEVEDRPGATEDLLERLTDSGVHVKGHCITGRREGRAEVALAVDDEARARQVLGLPDVLEIVASGPAGAGEHRGS